MKKQSLFVVIVLLLMMLWGCANVTQKEAITYTNDKYRFTMQIPGSWKGRYFIADNKGVGIALYSQENYDAGWGGYLGVINKVPASEFSDLEVRTLELARAEEVDDKGNVRAYVYALYFASDVNWDIENPALEKEYKQMTQDLDLIADSFELI